DPRADGVAVAGFAHVAAEHPDVPGLNLLRARDQPHERRLTHAIGADQSDHESRGDVDREAVEGHDLAVAMGHTLDGRHGRVRCRYWGGCQRLHRAWTRGLHRPYRTSGRLPDRLGGLPRFSGWGPGERLLERFGPRHRIVDLDIAHPPDTRLDPFDEGNRVLRWNLDLDPEHQLVALAPRLDLLGSELGL